MSDYFARLAAETPSRVWVNNPTAEEVGLALAKGAMGCTTNPSFAGNLARRAPDEILPLVDAVLAEAGDADQAAVADRIQERLVARIAERFRPIHEATAGRWGYVSIQGDPEADTDGEHIWEEAIVGRALGPNVAPKIPATVPGLLAFERVVERGWPVIVTEVFSLDQLVSTCEVYLRVTERTGVRPPFFMSPITGILGDHLARLVARDGLAVPAEVTRLVGVGLARRCAALVAERSYPVTLLFGGARIPEDLTGLVGGPHAATINWSTFAEILELDPPLEHTIDQPLDPEVERTLFDNFADVRHGFQLGGLAPGAYEEFGPVQHFRDMFIAARHTVFALVAARRRAAGGG